MYLLLIAGLICTASGQGLFSPFKLPSKIAGAGIKLGTDGINLAGANLLNIEEIAKGKWPDFKNLYNKTYKSVAEEKLGLNTYVETAKKVVTLNQDFESGISSFATKLNWYSDLVISEFNRLVNGFKVVNRDKIDPKDKVSSFSGIKGKTIPESVDWRERGAVTPVKHQMLCASCYAFSAAGALEGHTFRKTGKLFELSPQSLVDCTKPYGNDGCKGGQIPPSFRYIRDKGIDDDANYLYEAKETNCKPNHAGNGVNNTGFVLLDEGDEKGMEQAVAFLGPVSVGIDASHEGFQLYSKGIYHDPACKSDLDSINHAVLVVGYGVENGTKYWLVKNSYGPGWGIDGYIKMAKFENNHCGIATYASYPLV